MNATITYPNGATRTTSTLEELYMLLTEMQEEDPTVVVKLIFEPKDPSLVSDIEGCSIPDFEATPGTLLSCVFTDKESMRIVYKAPFEV